MGLTISLFIGIFETALESTRFGEKILRSPFPVYLATTTVAWSCLIFLSLEGVTHYLAEWGFDSGDPARHQNPWALFTDIIVAITAAFVGNFAVRVKHIVGGKTLLRLLLGRYHRPLRERKLFLFLDLADSTLLTRQLGDETVQAMIADFFADIDRPILTHGGETHRYIGDEVVLTWPYEEAQKSIDAMEDVIQLIENREAYYLSRYRVLPRFRVGIHGGEIVASEVGGRRYKEIVYFGDTINTASKLVDLAKERDLVCLVSEDIMGTMADKRGRFLEKVKLKGRSECLGVYEIVF